MLLAEVLGELERTAGFARPNKRVSITPQRALARRIKRDQPLAEALWATGRGDARVLATLVADPAAISGRVLAAWIDDLDDAQLCALVAKVAAGHPSAMALAAGWRAAERPWTRAVGWRVLALRAADLDDIAAAACLSEIERRIAAAPLEAREPMGAALVAIGARGDKLRTLAIETSRRISRLGIEGTGDVEASILGSVARAVARTAPRKKPAKRRLKAASGVTARARRASRGA